MVSGNPKTGYRSDTVAILGGKKMLKANNRMRMSVTM